MLACLGDAIPGTLNPSQRAAQNLCLERRQCSPRVIYTIMQVGLAFQDGRSDACRDSALGLGEQVSPGLLRMSSGAVGDSRGSCSDSASESPEDLGLLLYMSLFTGGPCPLPGLLKRQSNYEFSVLTLSAKGNHTRRLFCTFHNKQQQCFQASAHLRKCHFGRSSRREP